MSHELSYVIRIEASLAEPSAVSGPEIVPNQTFNFCVNTSAYKRVLDVSVWSTRSGVDPHVVIRTLTFAERQEYLLNLGVHFDSARSSAFGLIKNDKSSKEITLPNSEAELLTLARTCSESERNHC